MTFHRNQIFKMMSQSSLRMLYDILTFFLDTIPAIVLWYIIESQIFGSNKVILAPIWMEQYYLISMISSSKGTNRKMKTWKFITDTWDFPRSRSAFPQHQNQFLNLWTCCWLFMASFMFIVGSTKPWWH